MNADRCERDGWVECSLFRPHGHRRLSAAEAVAAVAQVPCGRQRMLTRSPLRWV
jgi:hypothetical protein